MKRDLDDEDIAGRAFALLLVVLAVCLGLSAIAGVAWLWMAVLA